MLKYLALPQNKLNLKIQSSCGVMNMIQKAIILKID